MLVEMKQIALNCNWASQPKPEHHALLLVDIQHRTAEWRKVSGVFQGDHFVGDKMNPNE